MVLHDGSLSTFKQRVLYYIADSGTVAFNAGQSMLTVVIKINGDVDAEPTETLFVN